MTLKDLKDFTKSNLSNYDGEYYIGKIDNTKEKALCFYNNPSQPAKINTYGGKNLRSYGLKSITIILRYGKNEDIAEQMANTLYQFFDEATFTINNKRVFCISRYDAPIPLGTLDDNVYEFSLIFDFYINKG